MAMMRWSVKQYVAFGMLSGLALVAGWTVAPHPATQANEPPEAAKATSSKAESGKEGAATSPERQALVEAARARAELLHKVYASTLDVMHHRYFRHDRATVPARAMEDVFAEMARQVGVEAKWLVVNAKEMSIDHKAKTEFDRRAVRAIASGEGAYEEVEKDWYRRAGAISLMNKGCLGCHLQFGSSAKKERFAALVIAVPLKESSRSDPAASSKDQAAR